MKIMKKFIYQILALTLLCLAGCGGGGAESPALAQNVVISAVTEETVAEELVWSGNITPAETTRLSFKVAGVIEDIYVHAGEAISAGQTLARLEAGDYEIQVRAAAAAWQAALAQTENILPAQVSQAKAQLDLTLANYARTRELYEAGAASAVNLEEITAKKTADEAVYTQATEALAVGRAETERARAAYDLALSQLADVEIKSPWDGVTLRVLAAAGESAAAGYPALAVGRTGEMWAEIGLTDAEAARLTPGLAAEVYVYGLEETRRGSLDEIGALADSATRAFTGRVRLDNADGRLRAGMIAQVTIEMQGEKRLLAPAAAVLHLAEGDVVYIYDANSGVARRRPVETGEIRGGRVEALAGLSPGEQVIVEGQFKLRDGDPVSPQ
ncbi:MAG: efflux RND transporter periplasmic adaptor subunit [Gracilibacteraceae bacterium]|jgi:RND family efflux transporter MFP subunit|nr:efflux RND transporter periplasmic adaptor subunit [Gracilibacteraceae bacterium]